MKHGIYIDQQETSVSTPVVAESGIPYIVGTAPVQAAEKPATPFVPVLCTSYSEAVEAFGYSDDWASYTLCEAIYSHFKLYAVQPVILCNVLDVESVSAVSASSVEVSADVAKLPLEAVKSSVVVTGMTEGEDYELYYSGEALCVELLEGDNYDATSVTVAYNVVLPSAVATSDIAAGIEAVDLCLTGVGTVPDLMLAPGWSEDTEVAALMSAKAAAISGLFTGVALVDLDASEVTDYAAAAAYKAEKGLTDERTVLCWPMVEQNGKVFHLSTHIAGLMAQIDADNEAPYESPSNKALAIDGCVTADGTEVLLSLAQANTLNGAGVLTALNFGSNGWVAWGNYTACYPSNTDVKDYILPVKRMFDWVGSTLVQTFWSKLDKPMTRRYLDSILDSCNIWLNGVVASGYLLGARCEALEEENTVSNLMSGIIKLHVYMTPPSPAQEVDFTLEYDSSYISAALS